MRSVTSILVLMLFFLFGCDQASMIKKFTPPEGESIAKNYITQLRQNNFEEIEKNTDQSIKTADMRETLSKMAELIPKGEPDSVKLVGSQVFKMPEATRTNITYEYQFQNKWLLVNVATQKKGETTTIVGFNVNPIPDSLEKLNKFTLKGKNVLHYVVLILAILIPLFTIYALIVCVRTKIEKRKWLWIIFVLLGITRFTIDWTTGQWGFMPLNVQLFGASAFAPLYGSWKIGVSVPLGAIIFLLKRKSLSKQHSNNVVEPTNTNPEKEDWLGKGNTTEA